MTTCHTPVPLTAVTLNGNPIRLSAWHYTDEKDAALNHIAGKPHHYYLLGKDINQLWFHKGHLEVKLSDGTQIYHHGYLESKLYGVTFGWDGRIWAIDDGCGVLPALPTPFAGFRNTSPDRLGRLIRKTTEFLFLR